MERKQRISPDFFLRGEVMGHLEMTYSLRNITDSMLHAKDTVGTQATLFNGLDKWDESVSSSHF